ncbi:hypothetical protein Q1695_006411 [Nippostrongylus brasiliensis]|nr:hypothetical protein Q1695_006411 [Nippostrongylus brasiliensis]
MALLGLCVLSSTAQMQEEGHNVIPSADVQSEQEATMLRRRLREAFRNALLSFENSPNSFLYRRLSDSAPAMRFNYRNA